MSTTKTTYASVWKHLSTVDCTGKIQTIRGGGKELSYLSWAWAWGIMMEHYPEAQFYFKEDTLHPDDSVTVHVQVSIGELIREMWLPVMDHRNNAIKGPDARQISDTKMRALVKCFALYGLGHFIYAGEDMPPKAEEVVPEVVQEKPKAKAKAKLPANEEEMMEGLIEKSASGESPFPNDVENWDVTMATEIVDLMLGTIKGMAKSVDDMKSFWKANLELIGKMEKTFPEQKKKLQDGFTILRKQFEEGDK
jgi:hypothetical protein